MYIVNTCLLYKLQIIHILLHLSTEGRIIAMFGETIIDMPIDGKSTGLGTVSKRLEYNVHESFGYLTGDYLVTIGGTEGTETYVEYIGAGTNIHPGHIQYSCKHFVLNRRARPFLFSNLTSFAFPKLNVNNIQILVHTYSYSSRGNGS